MNGARTLKLGSLALATALLGGGAWLAHGGLKQLARERQQFAQLQSELDNARRLLPEVQQSRLGLSAWQQPKQHRKRRAWEHEWLLRHASHHSCPACLRLS